MSSPGKARATKIKPVAQSPSLSAEAHNQIMDYYTVAEKSKYPEIRAHALKGAKATGGYQRSQGARLSPNMVAFLGTGVVLAGALACWYAFLHYAEHLARELALIVFLFLIVTIGLYALLSGNLSESNFLRIIESVVSRFKSIFPGSSSETIDRLETRQETPSDSGDPPNRNEH